MDSLETPSDCSTLQNPTTLLSVQASFYVKLKDSNVPDSQQTCNPRPFWSNVHFFVSHFLTWKKQWRTNLAPTYSAEGGETKEECNVMLAGQAIWNTCTYSLYLYTHTHTHKRRMGPSKYQANWVNCWYNGPHSQLDEWTSLLCNQKVVSIQMKWPFFLSLHQLSLKMNTNVVTSLYEG